MVDYDRPAAAVNQTTSTDGFSSFEDDDDMDVNGDGDDEDGVGDDNDDDVGSPRSGNESASFEQQQQQQQLAFPTAADFHLITKQYNRYHLQEQVHDQQQQSAKTTLMTPLPLVAPDAGVPAGVVETQPHPHGGGGGESSKDAPGGGGGTEDDDDYYYYERPARNADSAPPVLSMIL